MQLLIVDPFEPDFVAAARQVGFAQTTYLPDAALPALLPYLATAHVLVLKSKLRLDAAMLKQLPHLQLVVRAGIGLDHIDVEAARQHNVAVRHTPGVNAQPVGEQALGMLLTLMHRIRQADAEVRADMWLREPNRGYELQGRTVGIVGYGHTGQAFARTLAGFQCRVLAYDKYRTDYSDAHAQAASWQQIEAEAEVLSLHVPLTQETRHLVDAARLRRMPRLRWLLNLSRGAVLDVDAALLALETGKLDGIALDVLPEEPPASPEAVQQLQRLAKRSDVLLTPHIGGWSYESAQRTNDAVLDILREFLAQRTGTSGGG